MPLPPTPADSSLVGDSCPPSCSPSLDVIAALLTAHGNTCRLIESLPLLCRRSRKRLIRELVDITCAIDDFATETAATKQQVAEFLQRKLRTTEKHLMTALKERDLLERERDELLAGMQIIAREGGDVGHIASQFLPENARAMTPATGNENEK